MAWLKLVKYMVTIPAWKRCLEIWMSQVVSDSLRYLEIIKSMRITQSTLLCTKLKMNEL